MMKAVSCRVLCGCNQVVRRWHRGRVGSAGVRQKLASRGLPIVVRSAAEGDADESMQDAVNAQRRAQVNTTQLLSKLLSAAQAGGAEEVAQEHAQDFDETFFHVASAYLEMAKKEEGNSVVVQQLEDVLRIAMRAKQATLRPEIQLLNGLLAADNWHELESLLQTPEAEHILMMNDQYFFGLVDRMVKDTSKHQPELAQRLEKIKKSAVQRVLRP